MRSAFSAVGALTTGITAVQCAAELEDPARFEPSLVIGTGGTVGSTGGTSGKAPPSSTPACVLDVMKASCAVDFCHSSKQSDVVSRGGLDLSGPNPAQQVVDVLATNAGIQRFDPDRVGACVQGAKLIDTSNPASSILGQRLNDTQACGKLMPASGTALTDVQKTCLTTWINDPYSGAANVITTGSGGTSAGGEGTAGKGDGGP